MVKSTRLFLNPANRDVCVSHEKFSAYIVSRLRHNDTYYEPNGKLRCVQLASVYRIFRILRTHTKTTKNNDETFLFKNRLLKSKLRLFQTNNYYIGNGTFDVFGIKNEKNAIVVQLQLFACIEKKKKKRSKCAPKECNAYCNVINI